MEDNKKIIYPSVGMRMVNPSDLKPGEFSLAVNTKIESVSGSYLKLSNEQSNILCTRMRNYKVIGTSLLPALNLTFLFLINTDTNQSEIGFIYDQHNEDKKDLTTNCKDCNNPIIEDTPLEEQTQYEKCIYYTFVNADCLNFSINHPVKSWIKVDDCNIRIYFVDGLNPDRFIDYSNFQKIDISNCPLIETNALDCDKIKIFPTTCYPQIDAIDVVTGGENQAGTYQFAICYADVRSNKVTDYYYVTDPIPLFQEQITIPTDYPIAKSIKLQISNLNTDFKYINLAVLKTINNVTTPYLVETIQVSSNNFTYLYTGIDVNIQDRISIDEILGKKPFYTSSNGIGESNGYLMLDQLKEQRILNLQPVSIDLPLYYQTVQLTEGDYKNPIIASHYVGYLGDEVYPFGIAYTRTNGEQTAIFSIAGRKASPNDLKVVNNADVIGSTTCIPEKMNANWQVYNTAIKLGKRNTPSSSSLTRTTDVSCISPKYQTFTDSGGNKTYYTDPGGVLIPNLTDFICANCLVSVTAQYSVPGVTLDNIVNISTVDDFNQISPQVTTTIPTYPSDSGVVLPVVDPYPYSNNPCIINLNKVNVNRGNAYYAPQNFNSQCITDTGNSYCSFAINPSGVSHVTACGNDQNQSWYYFIATSNVAAISIYTNNSPVVEVSTQNPATSLIENIDKLGNFVPNQCYAQGYNIFQNLIIGTTYYVKIYSVSGSIPNPSDQGGKQCYFRICVTKPDSNGNTQSTVNEIDTLNCKFRVTYTTTNSEIDSCIAPNYEYGLMSYWESIELYPCNKELFGDLAGKPIRHHKFPDNIISPFFQNVGLSVNGFNVNKDLIYPKGIVVDVKDIKEALVKAELEGLISSEERNSICGYRIYRGNRRGNEAIIGKGLLYDIWEYTDNVYNTNNKFLFPNFPYNDNNPNLYIESIKPTNINTINDIFALKHPFDSEDRKNNKYAFNAPNLLFNNPGLGVELKLECEQYGFSQGTYQDVKNNSKYQYIGPGIISAAIGFACIEAAFEALSTMAQATLVLPITVFGTGTGIPLGFILAVIGENISSPFRMFSFYGQYYDLISKFAPFVNYASFYSSIGHYDNYLNVDNNGNKRRLITNTEYLKPGILNVPTVDGYKKLNNFKRETSTFIEIQDFLPSTTNIDSSRFVPQTQPDWDFQKIPRPISSYYASMKNILQNQYGNIDSIDWLDTGYNGRIEWNNDNQSTVQDTILGGDTFINRFSNKRKVSFFTDDRITPGTAITVVPDNSDILLSELPNIGYPRYFMNYPNGLDYNVGGAALFGQVAVLNSNRADYNFSKFSSTGTAWATGGLAAAVLGGVAAASFGVISLGIAVGAISQSVKDDLGNDVYLQGKYFHSCYGINSFLVESNYNLDYRYGENNIEKDFYPHVADTVQWTQEYFVPMNYDNFYFYNKDYSKQNHENPGVILNNDYKRIEEDCKVNHQNRVIYSLQDNDQNDRFDGNLIFLANNYFDFPKSAGKLKLVKGIENNKVMVLQENQASIFNSYVSNQNIEISQSTVGSNQLFNRSIPSQFIKTDLGYGGSQVSLMLSTEFGHYWVDNKRGDILSYTQEIGTIIKSEDSWWFKENLPFKILKDFPNIDIDNCYKYFGMSMVYDARYKRIMITKRDAELRTEFRKQVELVGSDFIYNNTIILPTDKKYFINRSWTIGYSPIMKSFISFYSFTPNYYVGNQNYFQSGINYSLNNDVLENGLWSHGITSKSFQCFYGKLYSHIIQYSLQSKAQNKVLDYIQYISEFSRYQDNLSFALINDKTFNKILITNQAQTSGILELIPKQKNNLFQFTQYPKQTPTSRQILVENLENIWSFNDFYDISIQNGQPIMQYNELPYTELNPLAISYKSKYLSNSLRSDYHSIRMINDKYSNYQIVTRFNFINTTNSIA